MLVKLNGGELAEWKVSQQINPHRKNRRRAVGIVCMCASNFMNEWMKSRRGKYVNGWKCMRARAPAPALLYVFVCVLRSSFKKKNSFVESTCVSSFSVRMNEWMKSWTCAFRQSHVYIVYTEHIRVCRVQHVCLCFIHDMNTVNGHMNWLHLCCIVVLCVLPKNRCVNIIANSVRFRFQIRCPQFVDETFGSRVSMRVNFLDEKKKKQFSFPNRLYTWIGPTDANWWPSRPSTTNTCLLACCTGYHTIEYPSLPCLNGLDAHRTTTMTTNREKMKNEHENQLIFYVQFEYLKTIARSHRHHKRRCDYMIFGA